MTNQISRNTTPAPKAEARLFTCSLWLFCAAALTSLAFTARTNAADASDVFYGPGAGGTANTANAINDTAIGYEALNKNTDGRDNTSVGTYSLLLNTTGNYNTATGSEALQFNTTGSYNTANGKQALWGNDTGSYNTASGYQALWNNVSGSNNVAAGGFALYNNTTGGRNTASGLAALYSNTTGGNNTADGNDALALNTTGSNNTATGLEALAYNTTGSYNVASGVSAMRSNTTGIYNTAGGVQSLQANTTGNGNSAFGINALYKNTTGTGNVGVGFNSLFNNTTGGYNIALGYFAGRDLTTGTGNIDIGNLGVAGDAFTIRIGSIQNRTFISGIRNAVAAGGVAVFAAANGQLGTNPSSKRFKQDIADMDKQSEAILALHPVSFRYKEELDPIGTAQFGLIAEEVAKVNPDLVARDDKGDIYSVRYEAVNAMLLNEFLKEHKDVQDLKATIAQQQKQIEALTTGLRKVGDQLEVSKAATQVVVNNQ